MLDYEEPVYRPPSEANSLIIQATIGCSFNKCSFCAMYKDKQFRARPIEDITKDIEFVAKYRPDVKRVFLADGDAMTLPTDRLLEILDVLKKNFPDLNRVSAYATPGNLLKKDISELRILKENKLSLVYLGIESGNDEMLKKIRKGASADAHVTAINKTTESGMKISCMVILGLGGKKYWKEHIVDSAKIISKAPPTFLSTLQLRLYPDTIEDFYNGFGEPFEHQDDDDILIELETLVENMKPEKPVIFRSNHASNALPLAGTLPKDTEKLLATIKAAKDGLIGKRHYILRGL